MPRRRRRRGRARYRARSKYARRSTAFRKFRRSRRRRAPRPALRLYPGGSPATHLVKLRVVIQATISNVTGEWGAILLNPASMLQPFISQGDVQVDGIYTGVDELPFHDKAGGEADILKQPQGYDHWISGTQETGKYGSYTVVGSHTNITFFQGNSAGTGASERMIGGFTTLFGEGGAAAGPTFADKYAAITGTEVATMLSVGIIKRPKLITVTSEMQHANASFDFYYSQKKWLRTLRRIGHTVVEQGFGTFSTAPPLNPNLFFVMADLGIASGTAIPFHCIITIEYTVRLSDLLMSEVSVT